MASDAIDKALDQLKVKHRWSKPKAFTEDKREAYIVGKDKLKAAIQAEIKRQVVEAQFKMAHQFRDDAAAMHDGKRNGWWFSEQYWNDVITALQQEQEANHGN